MTEHKYLPSSIGISAFGLIYKRGGSTETVGLRGTNHLMEHLMCKTFDDMRPMLRKLGIDHNASTSSNRVVFWWKGLDEEVSQVKQLLVSRMTDENSRQLWSEQDFNNEKATVLQEYADCFNDQLRGFYENTIRKYYNNADAIGMKADIEAFTYKDSLACADTFLIPDVFFEVGHKSEETLAQLQANPNCAPTYISAHMEYKDSYAIELESIPKEDKTVVGLIGSNPLGIEDYPVAAFICSCINCGLESPLYQEIREKRGLSYFSLAFANMIGRKFVPFFASSTTNDHADELAAVYTEFFSTDPSQHISIERFEICKAEFVISEKKDNLLPHSGVSSLILAEINPYTGIQSLTYEDMLAAYKRMFDINTLKSIRY